MKTTTLILAMLIAVSTVALAANDRPDITVVSTKGSEVFKVIYKGTTSGKVKLSIFDSKRNLVLSEAISGRNGFICPLNFKGLAAGNYTIELVDDLGSYQENVLYVPANELKSVHATRLENENKFLLAIANAQNEQIVIRIYDENQALIHHESKTLNGDFAQVYNVQGGLKHYVCEVTDEAGKKKVFVF